MKNIVLSALLDQFLKNQATTTDKELIEQMIFHYMSEYDNVKRQSNNISAIYNLQTHLDQIIEENYKDRLFSCKVGCYYCCQQHVTITNDEAELIMKWCKRNAIAIEKRKLYKQQNHNLYSWKELSIKDRTCVFLGKNKQCRIYDYRPLVCRKHFSAGDPNDCNIEIPKIIPLAFDIHIESIISAALNKSPSDSLAKQILKTDKYLKNKI